MRVPRGPRHGRLWLVLPLVAAGCGLILAAAREDGFSAQAVDLGAGSVWVASTGPGQLALLDGASAQIAVKLRVAQDNDDVVAVTGTGAGYAVNRTTGTVVRVDGATWHPGDAHILIGGSAGGLDAIAGDGSLYVADRQRGLAIRADPVSLQPDGEPRSLSAIPGPGSPVLDSRGVLWLLDAQRGNLIRMTDSPQIVQSGLADPAGGRLVLADDRPVVVDLAAGTATPIDPGDGSSGSSDCMDVDPGDAAVHILGGSTTNEIYAVSGTDGVLRITDLDTGDCSAVVSDIAPPGSDLGQPVEAGRHVFIPDYGTGQVIVVDLDGRSYRRTQALVEPNAGFDLMERDGFVFYNQRTSNRAGVIDPDGSVRTVPKYNVDDPGRGVFVPPPDPSDVSPADPPTASPDAAADAGSPTPVPPSDAPASTTERSTTDRSAGAEGPFAAGGSTDPPRSGMGSASASPPGSTLIPPPRQDPSSPSFSAPTTSSPVAPSAPRSPTGTAPQVDGITLSSFPNDGQFRSGDVLTFTSTAGGGTPDAWSWRLRYANDHETPQNQVEHTSTEPSFSYPVDSGGSSFQKWVVDVTVTNAFGSDSESRVFTVTYIDGRPLQVSAVNAAPNPVVTGTQVTIAPSIQGPLLTCEWWIDGSTGHVPCHQPHSAPAVGDYTVQVKAVSRQNTTATSSQSLRVKNIDPPTLTACTAPDGVGAHENLTVSAAASGTVTAWHWRITRGDPPQDTGDVGDTAGSFIFVPAVAGAFRAEVWVSNAGGDSAHQTCSFVVVDRTPPDAHTVKRSPDGVSIGPTRFTLSATDPESPVIRTVLTVEYRISNVCTGADLPGGLRSATSATGSVSFTIDPGSCQDNRAGIPQRVILPNMVVVDSISSSATSGGGQADWTE